MAWKAEAQDPGQRRKLTKAAHGRGEYGEVGVDDWDSYWLPWATGSIS